MDHIPLGCTGDIRVEDLPQSYGTHPLPTRPRLSGGTDPGAASKSASNRIPDLGSAGAVSTETRPATIAKEGIARHASTRVFTGNQGAGVDLTSPQSTSDSSLPQSPRPSFPSSEDKPYSIPSSELTLLSFALGPFLGLPLSFFFGSCLPLREYQVTVSDCLSVLYYYC